MKDISGPSQSCDCHFPSPSCYCHFEARKTGPKTAADFLDEGAKTFRERNAIYGDNYKNVGGAMAALFPEGVMLKTADDWNRMHIFILGIVKQSRYANNWSKGGHADSSHDNTVYSAMLEGIDAEILGRLKE